MTNAQNPWQVYAKWMTVSFLLAGGLSVTVILTANSLDPAGVFGDPLAFSLTSFALLTLLVRLTYKDLTQFRLPNPLTYGLTLAGLMLALFQNNLPAAFIGAILGFLIFWGTDRLFYKIKGYNGLGLGDAKLMASLGSWFGPLALAPAILISSLTALAVIALLAFTQKLTKKGAAFNIDSQHPIPFGVFICVTFWLFWIFQAVNPAGFPFM